MIKVLLLTAVAIYGLLYAADPKKFLLYFRKSRVLRSEKRRKGKLMFR